VNTQRQCGTHRERESERESERERERKREKESERKKREREREREREKKRHYSRAIAERLVFNTRTVFIKFFFFFILFQNIYIYICVFLPTVFIFLTVSRMSGYP